MKDGALLRDGAGGVKCRQMPVLVKSPVTDFDASHPIEELLMSAKQLLEHLGVSEQTVRSFAQQGELHAEQLCECDEVLTVKPL